MLFDMLILIIWLSWL